MPSRLIRCDRRDVTQPDRRDDTIALKVRHGHAIYEAYATKTPSLHRGRLSEQPGRSASLEGDPDLVSTSWASWNRDHKMTAIWQIDEPHTRFRNGQLERRVSALSREGDTANHLAWHGDHQTT